MRMMSKARTESQTSTEAAVDAATAASYKTDALDELLEDSLFKKKKAAMPVTEETILDAALKAKVDPKDFNIDSSAKQTASPAPAAPAPADDQQLQTYSNM